MITNTTPLSTYTTLFLGISFPIFFALSLSLLIVVELIQNFHYVIADTSYLLSFV